MLERSILKDIIWLIILLIYYSKVVYNLMIESYLSKSSLLSWVKETTSLPASQLQDLSTGVHFCILLHHLTLGKYQLNKINYKAKLEYESLNNLKQLQYGLQSNGIQNKFDINKIAAKNIKAILETLQWFRKEYIRKMITDKKGLDNGKKVVFKSTKELIPRDPACLPKKMESQNQQETETLIKSLRKNTAQERLLPPQIQQLPTSETQKEKSQPEIQTKNQPLSSKQQLAVQQNVKVYYPLGQNITFGEASEQQIHIKSQNINPNNSSAHSGQSEIKYPKMPDHPGSAKDKQTTYLRTISAEKPGTNHKEDKDQLSHKKKPILKVQFAASGQRNPNSANHAHFDPKILKSGSSVVESLQKSVHKFGEEVREQKTMFSMPQSFQRSEEKREDRNDEKSKSISKYSNLLSSQQTNARTRMI